jgi:hypothetical protein
MLGEFGDHNVEVAPDDCGPKSGAGVGSLMNEAEERVSRNCADRGSLWSISAAARQP